MEIVQALRTALRLEAKLVGLYEEAGRRARAPVAQKIFGLLADEERDHLALLESRAAQWEAERRLTVPRIESSLPRAEALEELVARLHGTATPAAADARGEIEALEAALEVEQETSSFYEQMAAELSAEGRRLFRALLEIEASHLALVRAQIDALNGYGFWFDLSH